MALKKADDYDKVKFPLNKIVFMFICYIVIVTFSLLKGNRKVKSLIGIIEYLLNIYIYNIVRCSVDYWLMYFAYLIFAIFITALVAFIIIKEYSHRQKIGYKFTDQDVKWTNKILLIYPIYAFLSGMAAGFLGIGGGLVLGPLLLDLGLHPLVSSATCNFLVVFISSSTALQFMFAVNFYYNFIGNDEL